MEQQLVDILAWLDPHALLFALLLPPLVRLVGHWLPEELFMVAVGVLAARSQSPARAWLLLTAVLTSHLATDQAVFVGGRWLRSRLDRFPRIARRLRRATERLEERPGALLGLIPARVLPLGRGAWLAACGVVGVPWFRFLLVDLAALLCHLCLWSGLGWWLAGDLGRVALSAEVGQVAAFWSAIAVVLALSGVAVWRSRPSWQPASVAAVRRAGRALRTLGEREPR